jgi:NAD(P)-dependent dehydrogenase (short-subunit alcohol dehydrogenase family)
VPRTRRLGRSSKIRHGQLARMSCGRILGRSMPSTAQQDVPGRDDLAMTPDFGLHGRACLVTGAARGIGRAIALALAEAGADVALGLRDSSTGGEVVDEIAATGRAVLSLQMDVTDLDQVTEAVEAVVRRFGRIDVLVNNAGIGPPETPAEDVRVQDFDDTVALNLKGTFFASQAAGQAMIAQGGGRIVNLSSQAGFVALPGEAVYCMTKAAISHLTKCLAVEWGEHGITVNAVAPTFIATPGTEPALSDPGFRADVEERIAALHRIGTPDDVTGAVVFLASPAASLITGQTLLVDGGWTSR